MSVKALIQNKVSRHLFSTKRRDALRVKAERQRRAKNEPHIVEYFHEAGDPYSHLIVQVLPDFCQRYDIENCEITKCHESNRSEERCGGQNFI